MSLGTDRLSYIRHALSQLRQCPQRSLLSSLRADWGGDRIYTVLVYSKLPPPLKPGLTFRPYDQNATTKKVVHVEESRSRRYIDGSVTVSD
jgi:hypothetical protein